jgi:hypothetical protein
MIAMIIVSITTLAMAIMTCLEAIISKMLPETQTETIVTQGAAKTGEPPKCTPIPTTTVVMTEVIVRLTKLGLQQPPTQTKIEPRPTKTRKRTPTSTTEETLPSMPQTAQTVNVAMEGAPEVSKLVRLHLAGVPKNPTRILPADR